MSDLGDTFCGSCGANLSKGPHTSDCKFFWFVNYYAVYLRELIS